MSKSMSRILIVLALTAVLALVLVGTALASTVRTQSGTLQPGARACIRLDPIGIPPFTDVRADSSMNAYGSLFIFEYGRGGAYGYTNGTGNLSVTVDAMSTTLNCLTNLSNAAADYTLTVTTLP